MPQDVDALVDLCKEELWARRRWDESPQLYLVRARRLAAVKLPRDMWGHHAPADVMEHLAGQYAHDPHLQQAMGGMEGAIGFAFRVEGWMVVHEDPRRLKNPSGDTYEDLGGMPSQRADRVEIRTMYAATSDGRRVMCTQRRDSGYQVTVDSSWPSVQGDVDLKGRLPDALARMVHTLLTAKLHERGEAH